MPIKRKLKLRNLHKISNTPSLFAGVRFLGARENIFDLVRYREFGDGVDLGQLSWALGTNQLLMGGQLIWIRVLLDSGH